RSGASRLAAPRWSSGPHSEGHHLGPIGVASSVAPRPTRPPIDSPIRDPNIKVAPSFMGIAPRQNHLQGLQDDHWPRTFQATRKFQIVEFTRYSSGSVRQDPMSKRIFDDAEFGLVGDADASARPTWVRYQVLAAACSLAVITYIHRVGFATAS